MASSPNAPVSIPDCSRGLSDWYPPRIDADRIALAWDVEFWVGTVAGRRNGSSIFLAGTPGGIGYGLFVHTPTTLASDDRLIIAHGASPGIVTAVPPGVAPVGVVLPQVPNDALNFPLGPSQRTQAVDMASLHGKLFIAAPSSVDRLHVYDGTNIRRTGLAQPLPLTSVVNAGSDGFTGNRGYRIRVVTMSGTTVLRRSEPSTPTTFVPSGSGLVARMTFPASPLEGETHWEVEEIAPSFDWYRIARVPIATLTYDDTLVSVADVATTGVLSEDIGDYRLQYSAQFLTVDEDRLLLGGSWNTPALSARVAWTPLGGATGVGNDERIPADVEGYLDFDALNGGGLTGLRAWEGKVIVFKKQQVHQMVRSSSRLRAYLPDCLSRRHGAIPGSIMEGTDVDGLSCLYFLDYTVGPMQLGFRGLRVLAPELQHTWTQHFNPLANIAASVTYHAEKRQVWWHVATGAATTPSLRWMYTVETDGMVFHTLPHPVNAAVGWQGKPHLLIDGTPAGTLIAKGDDPARQANYDNSLYRAYIRTRGYQLGGLMRRWQVDSAILEVGSESALATISVGCVRDFGQETRAVPVAVPAIVVGYLVVPIDNAYLTEALTMQFELGDVAPVASPAWQIHGFSFTWSLGSPSTGRG